MNRIYLLIIFVLLYNTAAAQVGSLNSTDAELSAIKNITMSDSLWNILSASDTGLRSSNDSVLFNKKTCVIGFIGCDETHLIFSDFTNHFNTEYLRTNDSQEAFLNAKAYFFNKYPYSPITPIMKCGE